MKQLNHLLIEKFSEAASKAYPELSSEQLSVDLTPATQEKFGHYQCNSAMKWAKLLRTSPREVAQALVAHVDWKEGIEKMEVAGPGFINITLRADYLQAVVKELLRDPRLGVEEPGKVERVVLDFSAPNIAKEMHVGHLRSTVIGDCLARLFEFLGHDTLRLNHVGDWGTSFGMLIAYLKREQEINDDAVFDLSHLMACYKKAKSLFDCDEQFKKQAQLEVVALQGGDPHSLSIWKKICHASEESYREIYEILDVELIDRGESFYNDQLPGIVTALEEKGLIVDSHGAKCIFLEGFQNREGTPLPLMLQKSDGGYTYDTTDMAAIRQRIVEEKADRIIYVIDAGQATHLSMIFRAAEKAGYLDPDKVRVDHVSFGLVLGPDGKKFRTRSGDTEPLLGLLHLAEEKAEQILLEKNPDMDPEERKSIAHTLGIGAVKYADLSCHRTGDYLFSYDRMLKFEGNTAAFLLYAYVRIEGIKRKVGKTLPDVDVVLEHPTEIALALQLLRFGEILEAVAQDLLPHRLTEYLYTLAEKFHAFFRDCRVQGSACEDSRLLLCEAVSRVIRQGLEIIGVGIVERM